MRNSSFLVFLALAVIVVDSFVVDYDNYPQQIAQWEDEVQESLLKTPSVASSATEEIELNSPFGEGVGYVGDEFEDDRDMHLGEDEEEEDEKENNEGMEDLISNLEISEDDSVSAAESAEWAAATDFDALPSVASAFPTHDYVDLRVKDDQSLDLEEENADGKASYGEVDADEMKDAITLIRRLYQPHKILSGSAHGIEAEIYLRKSLSQSKKQKKSSSSSIDDIATVNLDLGDVENAANKEWDSVQKHFKSFAAQIQTESRSGVKNLANWASLVRARLLQTSQKFEDMGKFLKRDAKSKWQMLKSESKKAGKIIKGLLVCPLKKGAKSSASEEKDPEQHVDEDLGVSGMRQKGSGVGSDATAFVVIRANDYVTDWVHNFKHEMTACHFSKHCNGRIHHGYALAYNSIRNDLVNLVKMAAKTNNVKRVVIAGHSLGGALAVLHAVDALHSYPPISVGLVTFGQPKVGDENFAHTVDTALPEYPRVVTKFLQANCQCGTEESADYVSSLPTNAEFVHAGMEVSVPCAAEGCATRCCPQSVIHQVNCHAVDKYLHAAWGTSATD